MPFQFLTMNSTFISGDKIETDKGALESSKTFQRQAEAVLLKETNNKIYEKNKHSQIVEYKKDGNKVLNRNKHAYKTKKQRKWSNQAVFELSVASAFASNKERITKAFSEQTLNEDFAAEMFTTLSSVAITIDNIRSETSPKAIMKHLFLGALAASPQYMRRAIRIATSSSKDLIEYFVSKFSMNPFSEQSVAEIDDSNPKFKWIAQLPEAFNDWNNLRSSPVFEKISNLISVMVTMGLIDKKHMSVSVHGFEMFRLATLRKHANAVDLFTAIFDTITTFAEGGYRFFTVGNPMAFFFHDDKAEEFQDLYLFLTEANEYAKVRNLHLAKLEYDNQVIHMSDKKFDMYLTKANKMCNAMLKSATTMYQKNALEQKAVALRLMRADFDQRRSEGHFKERPFSLWCAGAPGVGKSTLIEYASKACMRVMGVPNEELNNIAWINSDTKHDDTISADTMCIMFDDIGNTKPDFVEKAPTKSIIEHNNNIPCFANKAELAEKGKVPIMNKLNVYSGNLFPDELARIYAYCIMAIVRRILLTFEQKVRPEFALPDGRLDTKKVRAMYSNEELFTDVWLFKIYVCSYTTKTGLIPLDINYQPCFGNKEPHWFNIHEVMLYTLKVCKAHWDEQVDLRQKMDNVIPNMNFCDNCNYPQLYCICNGEPDIPRTPPGSCVNSDNDDSDEEIRDKLNNLAYIPTLGDSIEPEGLPAEWYEIVREINSHKHAEDIPFDLVERYQLAYDMYVGPYLEEHPEIHYDTSYLFEGCKGVPKTRKSAPVDEEESDDSSSIEDIEVTDVVGKPILDNQAEPEEDLIFDEDPKDLEKVLPKSTKKKRKKEYKSYGYYDANHDWQECVYDAQLQRWREIKQEEKKFREKEFGVMTEEEYCVVPKANFIWKALLLKPQKAIDKAHVTFSDFFRDLQKLPEILIDFGNIFSDLVMNNQIMSWFYDRYKNWGLSDFLRSVTTVITFAVFMWSTLCLSVLPIRVAAFFIFSSICAGVMVFIAMLTRWYNDKMIRFSKFKNCIVKVQESIAEVNMKACFKAFASVAVAYKVFKIVKDVISTTNVFKNVFTRVDLNKSVKVSTREPLAIQKKSRAYPIEFQSRLNPMTAEEEAARNGEESMWGTMDYISPIMQHEAKTITREDLIRKVLSNLYSLTMLDENDNVIRCNGLVLAGKRLLVPRHIFATGEVLKVAARIREGTENAVYKGEISIKAAGLVEGEDLALCWAPFLNMGVDLEKYIPIENKAELMDGTLLHRSEDGSVRRSENAYQRSSEHYNGKGFVYKMAYNSKNGDCIGTSILYGKFPGIGLVHLRGRDGEPYGAGRQLDQELIGALNASYRANVYCVRDTSMASIPTKVYDIETYTQSRPIHPNSPLNYMPIGSNVLVVGSNDQRVTHVKSTIGRSAISHLLEEICPNKWDKPNFNVKRNFRDTLIHSANPSVGLPLGALMLAIDDFKGKLLTIGDNPVGADLCKRYLKPLSRFDNLNGIPGVRFLDGLNLSTSKGFPETGPKRDWIIELNPDEYPQHPDPKDIDPKVWERVDYFKERIREGKRAFIWAKACLKDEAKEKDSTKVRVFEAHETAGSLIVREYSLPWIKISNTFPLISESVIGINCHGPEWHEMISYLTEGGTDGIIAADFSKYDRRMPAQIIAAVEKIFVEVMMELGDYSEDDKLIMEGLITEATNALVSFNGDCLIHVGHTSSGNSKTTITNGGGISVILRVAYYVLMMRAGFRPRDIPPFALYIRLLAYGDDSLIRVWFIILTNSRGEKIQLRDVFNFLTIKEVLAECDLVLTTCFKDGAEPKFFNIEEVEFLKRKPRFDEKRGIWCACLEEDSIFKSLHVHGKTSYSPTLHCAINIENALREWFFYGRDHFNMRRTQMIEIAEEAGIANLLGRLDESTGIVTNKLYWTYDDYLSEWNSKYAA